MSTTPPKEKDKTLEDDPLGIGIGSSKMYIGIGACVCLVLLCIIGFIFVLTSKSSKNDKAISVGSVGTDTVGSVNSIPTHYTIEFKYADGVNPYNNFSIPPFVPKPSEFFGKTT